MIAQVCACAALYVCLDLMASSHLILCLQSELALQCLADNITIEELHSDKWFVQSMLCIMTVLFLRSPHLLTLNYGCR